MSSGIGIAAAQVQALESQLAEARAALHDGERKADEAVAAYRQRYPTQLQFPYRFTADSKPFYLRAMFHDDHRTFIQSGARELPTLYEMKDGKPNLVNFDIQHGIYVVPKVLDDGYLMIGTARIPFQLRDVMGLAYTVGSSITSSASMDPGVFVAQIGTEPKNEQQDAATIKVA